jgi:hypothetical protein
VFDYQTLGEKSMAGFYVLKDGGLSSVNARLCQIPGFDSCEGLIGSRL